MGDCLDQPVPTRSFRVLVYPSSMPVSNRALQVLADALRHRRTAMGSRWRRLPPGRQALLVLAHLRKGETYTALAGGFGVGTTTVFRYIREGVDVLAAVAPTLDEPSTELSRSTPPPPRPRARGAGGSVPTPEHPTPLVTTWACSAACTTQGPGDLHGGPRRPAWA